jgi:hypothetical protein
MCPWGWREFVGNAGRIVGLDHFGASGLHRAPAERSVSGCWIALGDPLIAAFLEFLLQGRERGPVGLICLAVDPHRTVARPGERILRFLAGTPQRGRQFMTGAAIPAGSQHHASFCSRVLAVRLVPSCMRGDLPHTTMGRCGSRVLWRR